MGRVLRAHGVRGDLLVGLDPTLLHAIGEGLFVTLERAGDRRRLRVLAVREHARGRLVRLEGIGDREEARSWAGARVFVDHNDLPPLADGEYYDVELVGLDVIARDGRHLGKVESVLATGANDVCIVSGRGEELLVPMTEQAVVAIDRDNGRLIVEEAAVVRDATRPGGRRS